MEKELRRFQMAQNTQVNLPMDNLMDMESLSGVMELFMKVTG